MHAQLLTGPGRHTVPEARIPSSDQTVLLVCSEFVMYRNVCRVKGQMLTR